jgi:hypothetical protein
MIRWAANGIEIPTHMWKMPNILEMGRINLGEIKISRGGPEFPFDDQ